MTDQPRTQPLSRWETFTEAVGWFVALVLWNLNRVPAVWRRAGRADRTILVLEFALLAVMGWLLVVSEFDWLWATIVVLFTLRVVMEFVRINREVAEHERRDRVLVQQPTGAPRLAVVQCAHGDYFRFAYGPQGWQELGPATPGEIPH